MIQYRAEAYNILNRQQVEDIDRRARFDATGVQANANFGKATRVRNRPSCRCPIWFTF